LVSPRFFEQLSCSGEETGGLATGSGLIGGQAGGPVGEHALLCGLCPHRCRIPPGKTGRCGARENRHGEPYLPYYGYITGMAEDPIEKKPLYHFRPGSAIFSVGFAGCNLRCPFCQNWHISQICPGKDIPGRFISPEDLISAVKRTGHPQIAYTYSEPLIHIEYFLDCMELAHKEGIANVLVSNGCVNRDAAGEIIPLIDAANIDLKCFSAETYTKILGGDLAGVKNFISQAYAGGVHVEVTTLVVPDLNDGNAELDGITDFLETLAGGQQAIPLHLSAYHPGYRWEAPATEGEALTAHARRAGQKLPYVYTGNIRDSRFSDTFCPECGQVLVERRGYRVNTGGLVLKTRPGSRRGKGYVCANCGKDAPIFA
jgi:pyruvate formate lyase activating enzyme